MSSRTSYLPRPKRNKVGWICFCLSLVVVVGRPALSQQGSDKNESSTTKEREERLQEMKQRLSWITVSVGNDAARQTSLDQPLLRFSDPAREFHDGGLWAFGAKGRPAMLLALERYEPKWNWELIALSSNKLSAALIDGWKWAPAKAALDMRELSNAGAGMETEAARMRQMKSFMRRFAAVEHSADDQRFELRLLPQPLLRYSDPAERIVDGAMFAFVYGTNPEVIVLIEYRKTNDRTAGWWYGLVPLTTARATASLDGKEVWSKPTTPVPKLQDPYTYMSDPIANPSP